MDKILGGFAKQLDSTKCFFALRSTMDSQPINEWTNRSAVEMAFYQRERIRRCGRDVSMENREIQEDKRRARSSRYNRTFNLEHLILRRYVQVARFRNLLVTSENCLRFLINDCARHCSKKLLKVYIEGE